MGTLRPQKSGGKLLAAKQASVARASTTAQERPVVKSDIDELPRVSAKTNKSDFAIVIGIEEYRQQLPRRGQGLFTSFLLKGIKNDCN